MLGVQVVLTLAVPHLTAIHPLTILISRTSFPVTYINLGLVASSLRPRFWAFIASSSSVVILVTDWLQLKSAPLAGPFAAQFVVCLLFMVFNYSEPLFRNLPEMRASSMDFSDRLPPTFEPSAVGIGSASSSEGHPSGGWI